MGSFCRNILECLSQSLSLSRSLRMCVHLRVLYAYSYWLRNNFHISEHPSNVCIHFIIFKVNDTMNTRIYIAHPSELIRIKCFLWFKKKGSTRFKRNETTKFCAYLKNFCTNFHDSSIANADTNMQSTGQKIK